MINFDSINQSILLNYRSIVSEWLPGGRTEGEHYVVKSPFRDDKTPGSFRVNIKEGYYKDFADEPVKGPDPIHLYARLNNLTQGDAAKALGDKYGGNYTPPPVKKKIEQWRVITPVPVDAPQPPKKYGRYEEATGKKRAWTGYKIVTYYPYHNESGKIIGYTVRFIGTNGKKEVVPLTFRTNGKEKKWIFRSWDRPRPIYGLDDLFDNPEAQVLIVEGEKCRDFAAKLFKDVDGIVPIAWVGGGKGAPYINWKPLKGRKVIFWPDADSQSRDGKLMDFINQPGASTMIKIYNLVKQNISGGRLISPPKSWNSGKDIADLKGWTSDKLLSFIGENIVTFESLSQKPEFTEDSTGPFQCLGYNSYQGNVTYFYLPKGTRKVTALTAGQHSKMNLLSIAPAQYYEREYSRPSGADYVSAANDCMRECERVGMYDPARVRGRGAWFDAGRIVLHLGDRLIVDDAVTPIDDITSHFIYEAEIPTELTTNFMSNFLPAGESAKVLDICEMISWECSIHAPLFAGWLALAPICGALEWRPHIWLTGESGSGKSWILENIVSPILGNAVVYVEGDTTEAALRQTLGNDAFPVQFDEIESEDKSAGIRVQNNIKLARTASTNSKSRIIKGTISGRPITYYIRSCFLFSSVNVQLVQQADESRIKVLKLIKRKDYEFESVFDALGRLVISTLTDEYCQRFRVRAIRLIPTIRENARLFSRVASSALKSKREGDQIGALLAGAYNLRYDGVAEESKAIEIVESVNWITETAIGNKTDQERCLSVILQQLIRTGTGNNVEAVGLLLRRAGRPEMGSYMPETANSIENERKDALRVLRNHGLTVIKSRTSDGYDIGFANDHSQLKLLLQGTPWQNSYRLVLSRLPGAVKGLAVYADQCRLTSIIIPFTNVFQEGFDDEEF